MYTNTNEVQWEWHVRKWVENGPFLNMLFSLNPICFCIHLLPWWCFWRNTPSWNKMSFEICFCENIYLHIKIISNTFIAPFIIWRTWTIVDATPRHGINRHGTFGQYIRTDGSQEIVARCAGTGGCKKACDCVGSFLGSLWNRCVSRLARIDGRHESFVWSTKPGNIPKIKYFRTWFVSLFLLFPRRYNYVWWIYNNKTNTWTCATTRAISFYLW